MIEIPFLALRRLVTMAAPFASRDPLLPVFRTLHFIERGGVMYVEATDRYAAIRVNTAVHAPDGLDLILPVTACKSVLQALRPTRTNRHLLLEMNPSQVSTTFIATGATHTDVSQVVVDPVAGVYPRLDKVFDNLQPGIDDKLRVNAALLQRLPNGEVQMALGESPNPASTVRRLGFLGEDWTAVVTPLRWSMP